VLEEKIREEVMLKLSNQSSFHRLNNSIYVKTKCPLNKEEQRRFIYKKKSTMETRVNFDNLEEEINTCLMTSNENEKVTTFELCPLCTQMEDDFDNLLNDSNVLSEKCILSTTF
jgi:hypothetical protein